MKLAVTALLFIYCYNITQAQQEPNITTYLFNALSFNPAYAGSKGYLSSNLLHRSQWIGWNDSNSKPPTNQILTLHSPIGKSKRVGMGLNLQNYQAGVTNTTSINLAYAYRIPLPIGVLSAGLQSGIVAWNGNWNKLTFQDGIQNDPAFLEGNLSNTFTNFGAGVYLEAQKYYVGLSYPRLLHLDISSSEDYIANPNVYAQLYRQMYIMAGGVIPIFSEQMIFKPSLLLRKVGTLGKGNPQRPSVATPTSIDLDVSLFFLQAFWIGTSYRTTLESTFGNATSHDSMNVWAAFYLNKGVRLGLGYDFSLTALKNFNSGSLEIMVGYDFNYNISNVQSPRYF